MSVISVMLVQDLLDRLECDLCNVGSGLVKQLVHECDLCNDGSGLIKQT